MKNESALTYAELLMVDSLITIAQAQGLSMDATLRLSDDDTETVGAVHEAMWETRHGIWVITEKDREVVSKIRALAAELEFAPTLGQLIQARGEALRTQ